MELCSYLPEMGHFQVSARVSSSVFYLYNVVMMEIIEIEVQLICVVPENIHTPSHRFLVLSLPLPPVPLQIPVKLHISI